MLSQEFFSLAKKFFKKIKTLADPWILFHFFSALARTRDSFFLPLGYVMYYDVLSWLMYPRPFIPLHPC
jgi:hypothetical protein